MNPRRNLQSRKNRRKRNERWDRPKTYRVRVVYGFGILNKNTIMHITQDEFRKEYPIGSPSKTE